MKEYADDITSVLAELEGIINPALLESEEASVEIPDGCRMFSDIFGWTPSIPDFPVHVYSEKDAPALDPYWIWPRADTEAAVWAMENRMPVRLVGMPGGGKSEFARNVAAITGRALCRLNFHGEVFVEDILGKTELVNGETKFVPGEVVSYIQRPSVVLCDEVSAAKPSAYMGFLQPFLERFNLKLQATGETIASHPGMWVMGADNALGLGDNRSKFPTRNVQDISTLNRWPVTIHVNYMDEDTLAGLIKSHVPELHTGQCTKLAKLATMCQTAFMQGEIPLTFSLRQAIPIAKMAVAFRDMQRAIQINFLNSLSDSQHKAAIEGFMRAIW
jgi:MoxR-like ATPase